MRWKENGQMIKLSILIATMPIREDKFRQLISNISIQKTNEVEILFDGSDQYNIGVKRNKLLKRATGEYIIFIDDDDEIANNYVSLILNSIESKPDCVAINGIITTNGKDEKQWFISKKYKCWHNTNKIYYRTPNHISPVKRELALRAGFPEISHGEDHVYSMRLISMLKTETIIEQPIYHYKYISNK